MKKDNQYAGWLKRQLKKKRELKEKQEAEESMNRIMKKFFGGKSEPYKF